MSKKDDFVDYYRLLDVRFDATDDAIDRAYRAKIKQHHPDRHGGSNEADEHTKRLIEARTVLKDPAKRKAYNGRWFAHAMIRRQQAKKAASRPTVPEPQPRTSAPAWPSSPPPVAWTPPPPPPPPPPMQSAAPNGGGGWEAILGIAAVVIGGACLLSNDYDRRAGRYRGRDGTFRSGRFS